eukprot:Rhum_TRINITY_DN23040_c0_g1::Rhum_TRINITY_DN23040_c0_g1_i1::g.176987::m.176987
MARRACRPVSNDHGTFRRCRINQPVRGACAPRGRVRPSGQRDQRPRRGRSVVGTRHQHRLGGSQRARRPRVVVRRPGRQALVVLRARRPLRLVGDGHRRGERRSRRRRRRRRRHRCRSRLPALRRRARRRRPRRRGGGLRSRLRRDVRRRRHREGDALAARCSSRRRVLLRRGRLRRVPRVVRRRAVLRRAADGRRALRRRALAVCLRRVGGLERRATVARLPLRRVGGTGARGRGLVGHGAGAVARGGVNVGAGRALAAADAGPCRLPQGLRRHAGEPARSGGVRGHLRSQRGRTGRERLRRLLLLLRQLLVRHHGGSQRRVPALAGHDVDNDRLLSCALVDVDHVASGRRHDGDRAVAAGHRLLRLVKGGTRGVRRRLRRLRQRVVRLQRSRGRGRRAVGGRVGYLRLALLRRHVVLREVLLGDVVDRAGRVRRRRRLPGHDALGVDGGGRRGRVRGASGGTPAPAVDGAERAVHPAGVDVEGPKLPFVHHRHKRRLVVVDHRVAGERGRLLPALPHLLPLALAHVVPPRVVQAGDLLVSDLTAPDQESLAAVERHARVKAPLRRSRHRLVVLHRHRRLRADARGRPVHLLHVVRGKVPCLAVLEVTALHPAREGAGQHLKRVARLEGNVQLVSSRREAVERPHHTAASARGRLRVRRVACAGRRRRRVRRPRLGLERVHPGDVGLHLIGGVDAAKDHEVLSAGNHRVAPQDGRLLLRRHAPPREVVEVESKERGHVLAVGVVLVRPPSEHVDDVVDERGGVVLSGAPRAVALGWRCAPRQRRQVEHGQRLRPRGSLRVLSLRQPVHNVHHVLEDVRGVPGVSARHRALRGQVVAHAVVRVEEPNVAAFDAVGLLAAVHDDAVTPAHGAVAFHRQLQLRAKALHGRFGTPSFNEVQIL